MRWDDGLPFLLRYENIAWYQDGVVRILDRRSYPIRVEYVTCTQYADVVAAIRDMVTQSGGPPTAVCMGMALAAYQCRHQSAENQLQFLNSAAHAFSHARPTTSAALLRAAAGCLSVAEKALLEGADVPAAIHAHGVQALDEKYRLYHTIGRHLATTFPQNGTIMTQCFGETIVGTMLLACRENKNAIRVICPETRPYLQGARLTASCVSEMGFDATVITDNMPGYVLKDQGVDVFTSAADVITMDGHVINKIGTFQIALCAHHYGIPYYVTGQPDTAHPSPDSVVIEQRDPAQTTQVLGISTVLPGVKGYYPAFDITPPTMVTGIVTEAGILSPHRLLP
ncbi:s-methyl-5-thioribose-1-phosphate isomerase [Eubacteriales bacterium OttesenSCG-928-M02]|nr:s-methyl-5-thioribose-1-phosphate isomerase [Eubacteriales bacterium OttesenSCG-928-M02]